MVLESEALPVSNQYRELGQTFRVAQAALEVGIFTVSELESLTGVNANTIYTFVSQLGEQYIHSEALPGTGKKGRPRKRYSLTEAGIAMLVSQNANVLAAMGRIRTGSTPTLQQLLQQIMQLPANERSALIRRVQQSQVEQAAQSQNEEQPAASAPVQYETARP
jgi:DNA-binding PadR family transcriptional regulator